MLLAALIVKLSFLFGKPIFDQNKAVNCFFAVQLHHKYLKVDIQAMWVYYRAPYGSCAH